jgi:hypothetical protein
MEESKEKISKGVVRLSETVDILKLKYFKN